MKTSTINIVNSQPWITGPKIIDIIFDKDFRQIDVYFEDSETPIVLTCTYVKDIERYDKALKYLYIRYWFWLNRMDVLYKDMIDQEKCSESEAYNILCKKYNEAAMTYMPTTPTLLLRMFNDDVDSNEYDAVTKIHIPNIWND